jgi:hypothetical protein
MKQIVKAKANFVLHLKEKQNDVSHEIEEYYTDALAKIMKLSKSRQKMETYNNGNKSGNRTC